MSVQEILRWRSFQDLPDEEMTRSREEEIQERKCSFELERRRRVETETKTKTERRRRVEEEARRSSLEEQRRIHLRKSEEQRISLEAEVSGNQILLLTLITGGRAEGRGKGEGGKNEPA